MYFLDSVAENILKQYQQNQNLCIVCPNNRTIEYIEKYISLKIDKAIILPDMISLSELYSHYSELSKPDDLILLYLLFQSFRYVMKDVEEFAGYNFENFQNIGEILLHDFNDIDNYLVDVDVIFRNITDYEDINYIEEILTEEQINALKNFFGHFSLENLSKEKEYFLKLWSKIPEIYKHFSQKLKEKNLAYNGLIIKEVLANLDKEEIDDKYELYIFVGFNAITKAQQMIMKKISQRQKALFYWDYDNFYVKNKENEAGLFIRKNIELMGDDLKIDRDRISKKKNIKLYGFPLNVAQAKAVPDFLKMLEDDEAKISNTAIILPNENLLFPILHSLPENIDQINVTIGFPFNTTNSATLIFSWLKLLQKYLVNDYFLLDDVLDFFSLNLLKELTSGYTDILTEKLKSEKKIRISIDELYLSENETIISLFDTANVKSQIKLLDNLLQISENLFYYFKESNKIEVEALYGLYKKILHFKSILENEHVINEEFLTQRMLLKILMRDLNDVHIAFSGKSTEGLQLMTLMESRNMDFKNVIFLNLNEGQMPAKPSRSSLISEFMRRSFGMPLLVYQDSIFAYLFYRLFHNAENIILAYSNVVSDKSGEKSRFLQQLFFETDLIPEVNRFDYKERIVIQKIKPISVEKDEKLQQYLKGEKKLSASALNVYLSCSLKFYYQYIAELSEPEQEQDFGINDLMFGNIFHHTMEKLYRNFVNQEITSDLIEKQLKPNIDKYLTESTLEEFDNNKDALEYGINKVIIKVIRRYILITLNFDKQKTPFFLRGVEERFSSSIKIELNGKPVKIPIKGFIDRIDEKDNTIQIIDYKTGRDETSFIKMTDVFEQKKNTKAIFQLMLYTQAINNDNKYPQRIIEPHIYKIIELRNETDTSISSKKEKINTLAKESFEIFNSLLEEKIAEMFDTNIAFEQTDRVERCAYCPYKGFCLR